MVRLYVGGLPPEVAESDVSGRFVSFGRVLECVLAPSKGLDAVPGRCRGFGYVEFEPKDSAALARCLSQVSCW